MRMTRSLAALLIVMPPLSSAAFADAAINGVRIGAQDVAALARFYQTALGMHEVQRMQNPQFTQILLDFGATPEAARANPGPELVLRSRPSDDIAHDMGHVVFTVNDLDAAVKAVRDAGGRIEREPFALGNTGTRIALAVDTAGNHFELIQPARP